MEGHIDPRVRFVRCEMRAKSSRNDRQADQELGRILDGTALPGRRLDALNAQVPPDVRERSPKVTVFMTNDRIVIGFGRRIDLRSSRLTDTPLSLERRT